MPPSTPDATDEYEWTELESSGRGHLVAKEDNQRPIPKDDGSVDVETVTLCGNLAAEGRREFRGFDGHRNIDWCAMCKHLYLQAHGDGGLFGCD